MTKIKKLFTFTLVGLIFGSFQPSFSMKGKNKLCVSANPELTHNEKKRFMDLLNLTIVMLI